jgi:hypothetical protein
MIDMLKKFATKPLLLVAFIILPAFAFGQKSEYNILHNQTTFGKNLIDSSEIKGTEYTFPGLIYKAYVDTSTGYLTAQMRNISRNGKWYNSNGDIVLYDINNNKTLWSRHISYVQTRIIQKSDEIYYLTPDMSSCYDINTGRQKWSVKSNIYYVDYKNRIGLGYKVKTGVPDKDMLQGISLDNGNVLWTRKLNCDFGWNELFYTNDTTAVIVTGGLHSINVNNGFGWDYTAVTGDKDYSKTAATNVFGTALGIFTGTFVLASGYDLISDINSNTLVDSTCIYMASKEKITKVNKRNGSVMWEYPFPIGKSSKSSIYMNDTTLFMVNYGYVSLNGRPINYGTPFIAAYDRHTGKQKYLSLIFVKDDPILGFRIINNEFYLIFKNRISRYSFKDGSYINDRPFVKKYYGHLKNFIGNHVFAYDTEKGFTNINRSDTTKINIYTTNNKVLTLDYQLNVLAEEDFDNLGVSYLKTNGYNFISKDGSTHVINNNNHKVADINVGSHSFIIEDKLYSFKDKKIVVIDLSEIIKNNTECKE